MDYIRRSGIKSGNYVFPDFRGPRGDEIGEDAAVEDGSGKGIAPDVTCPDRRTGLPLGLNGQGRSVGLGRYAPERAMNGVSSDTARSSW